ncbi:hypothetical protein GOBAR_AA10532 [Gossypium barbadense]|uniref:Uncharacterized protein n=1 Tax=Gossypium barbadense TaxID=3634 RepID=A0A2P5Y3E3_GOSBA|nr:hypothetical protein GOBAR_AA10532 [Gossypium barbadense]
MEDEYGHVNKFVNGNLRKRFNIGSFVPQEALSTSRHVKKDVVKEKKSNLEEMLAKFISVSETHFQNTETTLKNQQVSIQGLETQIGQLSKLISERPHGSLPSNTEPNPREQLNAINVQGEEGFVKPVPEPRQEIVVSKGQGELTLRVGDETITLQARNSGNTMEIEGDCLNHSTKTNNILQPSLQEMSLKEAHDSVSSNSRGPNHEDRKLQIEELDEWRMHKPRTPDK